MMSYEFSKLYKLTTNHSYLIAKKSAQGEIRTRTVARHPLKVVRLPISPPGQGFQKKGCKSKSKFEKDKSIFISLNILLIYKYKIHC